MLFKRSNLNSNLALTLGHLNPALKNTALKKKRDCSQSTWIWVVLSSLPRQQGSLLRGGLEAGEKEKESTHPSHRPPRTFYFLFSITVIFTGIPSGSFCGGPRGSRVRDRDKDLFREFATREDGSNSGNQSNSSGSKRTCWNVFIQHGRTVLNIGWKWDEIFEHCKSIWTRNLFSQKNFTKVSLIPIFANINEFIIVKEQLIWLYQILLANISRHCCPSYIGLVTFFTYLEATHLSVFHRCSTRFPCNIQ